jgi:virginiamycin B lyase
MRITGSRLAVRRAPSGVAVAAALAGVLLLMLAGLWAPSAFARSSTALYYETESGAGVLAIDKLSLSAPRTSTRVVKVGNVGVFGIALGGPYIYWSTEAGTGDRGAIMRASLNGQDVRRLVAGLTSPESVIAVHGHVYWNDQNAIERVTLKGSHRQRHFIDLPQENGGGVADGLASDGTHLYFSRCQDNTIGRADLNGSHVEEGFISLGQRICPQGLAVAGTHIYWTQLGSGTIGRASLAGRDADGRWLNIRSDQGPFQVVADSAHVYWTWGGEAGSQSYTGRAAADRSNLDLRFQAGSLYPMALSGAG